MNKYQKWYDQLIETRKNRAKMEGQYYENHHIKPKSLGGSDLPENLISLLPKEHFIAHLLLAKIHCGKNGMKMAHALRRMITGNKGDRYTPNSRVYQVIRSISMEKCSGENNPMWGRKNELHPNYQKPVSENTRKKIGEKSKGRKWTEEQRIKRRESQLKYWANQENRKAQSERIKKVERTPEWNKKISEGQKGRIHSEETKKKISKARRKNG